MSTTLLINTPTVIFVSGIFILATLEATKSEGGGGGKLRPRGHMWPSELLYPARRDSQSFLQPPNGKGCQLGRLEEGSGPPPSPSMLACWRAELHHPSFFLQMSQGSKQPTDVSSCSLVAWRTARESNRQRFRPDLLPRLDWQQASARAHDAELHRYKYTKPRPCVRL